MRPLTVAVILSIAALAITSAANPATKSPAAPPATKPPVPALKIVTPPPTAAEPAQDEHDSHDQPTTKREAQPSVSDQITTKHEAQASVPDHAIEEPAPSPAPAAPAPASDEPVDATRALQILQEGNQRWIKGSPTDPNTSPQRRQSLSDNGQHPFVSILTCADSRLPVERVFDRGVGEIFTIRVAGNIAGDSEIATIEYGVEHLKTPLLVVMGHTKCGAVAAAATDAEVHGKVAQLVSHIEPAVERARRQNPGVAPEALTAAAVRENVWQTIFDLLKSSDVCRDMVKNGDLQIIGAICDIGTGKVDWMGEHPWQSELVAAVEAQQNTATEASAEPAAH